MRERALVIGVGNELRGDDGAGIAVARRLREAASVDVSAEPSVDVCELTGEPTELLEMWSDSDAVVLVDTSRSQAPPGTIRRIDASCSPLPADLGGHASTHSLGLAEALELARTIGCLPRQVIVYAIEGQRFETGAPMSDAVRRGVEALVARVLDEALRVSALEIRLATARGGRAQARGKD